MGTPLPVRILALILIVTSFSSCLKEKETIFSPRDVYTETVKIDSFYTYVQHIYTGNSSYLYTGESDSFVSYAILQFNYPDTLPIDSIFLTLRGDSIADTLYLYSVLSTWTEGHVLYDSLTYLLGQMFYKGYFNDDSITIKFDTLPSHFDSNGVIIYSNALHRFSSSEGRKPPILTIFSGDTSYTYHPYRDAFLCDHPLVGDTLKDTLLQGNGIGFVNMLFIPSDSLPLNSNFSRLEVGLYSPTTCTLRVYYEDILSDEEHTGDTTAFLSLIPVIDDMQADSVDTLEYIPIEVKMRHPFAVPGIFTLPADSLKLYMMYIREEE